METNSKGLCNYEVYLQEKELNNPPDTAYDSPALRSIRYDKGLGRKWQDLPSSQMLADTTGATPGGLLALRGSVSSHN